MLGNLNEIRDKDLETKEPIHRPMEVGGVGRIATGKLTQDLKLGLDVHDVVVGEDLEGLFNRFHRSKNFSGTLGVTRAVSKPCPLTKFCSPKDDS